MGLAAKVDCLAMSGIAAKTICADRREYGALYWNGIFDQKKMQRIPLLFFRILVDAEQI